MNNDVFEVIGGNKLHGDIIPQGAKNEALQVISAVLLSDQDIEISNIPNILDVMLLIELLQDMGVKVSKKNSDTYIFNAKDADPDILLSDKFKQKATHLRGSVMILGPLLARFKRAYLPKPGGDKIGRRRLDTHFLGFLELGAKFDYDKNDEFYTLTADTLLGKYILLEEPSVTGTANIVMAAVLAEGETTIFNAACEPYLQQLCNMLNGMGANIIGIGSNLLKIQGVQKLGGTAHTILPDMIEIGSFIGLAAMTQSNIRIKNCRIDMLGLIPKYFEKLGIIIQFDGDDIIILEQEQYKIQSFIDGSILTIADGPWPLFTPDLLSILLVTATQAKGSILVHQKMFESRLFFVDKLIDMGAKIILCDPHRATVIGINREYSLRGINMSSPDIRAGVSLLIAALSAKGKSTISNIHQIDRGYQYIDRRLQNLGAEIRRV
ncbi:MAG: UDP-N-acetylglucosamine 1-carboxyvinyltransferase [Sphingobacteriales bacterium]|jgi:UDP-N-acetylglucosamine 1-carboxyvinyltransferase|nr:MAG: UDP-N-acetylglucosamine 1-carboxyvinyltransferase [Sphingobacteriales bacterium]